MSQTGIGCHGPVENYYAEKGYDIVDINGKKITYRRVYDPETFSKNKTAKLASDAKYYAVSASMFGKNLAKSKDKAIYMYRVSKKKALSVAKRKGRFVFLRIKNGKIKTIVINAEKTAG